MAAAVGIDCHHHAVDHRADQCQDQVLHSDRLFWLNKLRQKGREKQQALRVGQTDHQGTQECRFPGRRGGASAYR
ncbi:hypothetical protein D3C76_1554530 [compost metagenome]